MCATTGIIELLSPAELEGVMAHELTHIANRDVMVMTLAALLRLARVDDRAVRVLLRRRRRRRRRPRDLRDHPRLARRLRRSRSSSCRRCRATASSPPTAARRSSPAGPSALSSALLKISGDDGAHPADRPARPRRDERVLHRPRRREELGLQPVLDAPADGEAHRGALAPGGAAAGRARKLRRMGFLDALLGKRKVKGPAPDRLFAISTAYVGLDAQQGITTRGVAGDRLPAAGDRRLPPDRRRHGGGPVRARARRWARRSRPRTTSSATAG